MMQATFCEYCMNENEYRVHKTIKTSILKNEEINYEAKEAICNRCSNEIFVSHLCDYNLNVLYEEYRENHNLIKIAEIQHIMIKYSIDEEALSLLLGWEMGTINRYLDGDIPTNSHSDILKKLYEDQNYYSVILQANKERIEPTDYNKSRQAVKSILSKNVTEEKIDAVIKYLLINYGDFTLLALEKLLYYTQAYYYMFTDNFLFEEDCEASVNGPIYKSVSDKYEKFGFEKVNKDILTNNKLQLEEVEENILESIIKFYGCYSGKILEKMTTYEAPWILTKTRTINETDIENDICNKKIEKSLILIYFNGVKEKYNITNISEMQKYSEDLFNKISM